MLITTLVLQDKTQGYILLYFNIGIYLPRMLVEFFSNLYIPSCAGKVLKFMVSTFLENALNLHFYSCPSLPTQSSPPNSCHHTLGRGELLIPPGSIYFENCFPQQQKEVDNLWFALLKFNQKIWRWLRTLGYLYFAWFLIFSNLFL